MAELSRAERKKQAKRAFITLMCIAFGIGVIVGIVSHAIVVKVSATKVMTASNSSFPQVEQTDSPYFTNTLEHTKIHPITTEPVVSNPENEWIKFTATAYCGCQKCCGEWAVKNRPNGKVIGAAGVELIEGVSIAADTSVLPKGTTVEIKSDTVAGTFIVHDTGGALVGNKIDLYFCSHEDALNFGVQTVYLRVIDK